MNELRPPIAMLAELTHRCPLHCPYCSNPTALVKRSEELSTPEWSDIFVQAAALGVLQVHLSGGEPTARPDLEALVAAARGAGLYANLVTAAVTLDDDRLARLIAAGLDHVQISFQDTSEAGAERVSGFRGGQARKLAAARAVRAAGLPLTVNAVMHRGNLDRIEDMIALACELDAHRLEIANVQYYGWALRNQTQLLPTRAQVDRTVAVVAAARETLKGRLAIDFVAPDYYAARPKKCMDGWASQYFTVTPRGRMLPCHAAETIAGFDFPNLRDQSMADIWRDAPLFNAYRGVDWMQEPCRSCDHRESDLGGCRCQAFALTGDASATDPACALSPRHGELAGFVAADGAGPPAYVYRG